MRKHRLVAIGDSLTQEFTIDAVHLTDRSYPAIIAREMGLDDQELSYPHHSRGRLPLNLWERGPEIQRLPLTHGIGGRLPSDRRYSRYDPCPWIRKDFDPSQHPHPIGEQAQRIGLAIDARNQTIEASVSPLVGRPPPRSLHEQRLGLPQQHKK